MNIKPIFGILLAALFFISCERNVEFDGQVTNSMVVVNSFITPDSVITAHVSVSRFFLKDSIDYHSVNNAEVNLWVNGVLKERMNSDSNGIYNGIYKPVISDQIKLTVNAPQMQQVSATTVFTEAPVILSVDTQIVLVNQKFLFSPGSNNDTIGIQNKYKVNYKLRFTDNVNQKNYYRLIVGQVSYSASLNYNTYKIDTVASMITNYSGFDFTDVVSGNKTDPLADDASPVSELLSNPINRYNVFSDDIFNGKTYTLQFSTNEITQNYFSIESLHSSGYNILKNKVYINLQSISKEYYQYLITRTASYATNYFSEPVQVSSNINGGIGILGSYTSSNFVKIDLP